jgi:N-sulfoglucosamine sulfohydrolase
MKSQVQEAARRPRFQCTIGNLKTDSSRMKSLSLILFALTLVVVQGQDSSSPKRPNIVFCIADDWGWPHSGSYGDAVVKTPTFDRIAKSGLLFEQAYVSAPSCTPSRNAILTGKYHWALGKGANLFSGYPEGHATYPREFAKAGYHVGAYRKSFGPGRDLEQPVAGSAFKSPEAFLKARPKDAPFCFWFGSFDPHRGYKAGSGASSGIDLTKIEVPPVFPDDAAVRGDIADYYFEVQRFDREVGELLDLLEKTGELSDTIIVMTGDHGWPFPRGKSNLYDLGTRVPLAIMWGDSIKAPGRRIESFVSLVDIAPTFYDLGGVTPPDGLHGSSLRGVMENDPDHRGETFVVTGKERHTPCQLDGMPGYPCRAIRTAKHLYIHNIHPDLWPAGAEDAPLKPGFADIDGGPTKRLILQDRDTGDGKKFFQLSCGKRPAEELYDCVKDPFQMNNLAGDPAMKQVLETLRSQMEAELKRTGDLRMEGKGDSYQEAKYFGATKK